MNRKSSPKSAARKVRVSPRSAKRGEIRSVRLADDPIARIDRRPHEGVVLHYSKAGRLVRFDVDVAAVEARAKQPQVMFLSMRTAAEYVGTHPATMRRMAAKGSLRALNVSGEWITTPEWLEEFTRTRRGPGRPRKSA